jgi:hypothetical protein
VQQVAPGGRKIRALRNCITVVALCSGCAAQPLTQQDETVAVWLHEQPRVLAVEVEPILSAPALLVPDDSAAFRLDSGIAAGAQTVREVLQACVRVGPLCPFAVAVGVPVGAVAGGVRGAVAAPSLEKLHSIAEAQGAQELYASAVSSDGLLLLFRRSLLEESEKAALAQVRLAAQADSGGTLKVRIGALDLSGDVGENPSVSLRLRAYADVVTPETTAFAYARIAYDGERRPISEWKADDARLFREEIAAAARAFAQVTVRQLRNPPSFFAVARVERRREAAAAAAAAKAAGAASQRAVGAAP